MNHNNFRDDERPSVSVIGIKKPIYIKVMEIGGFAFDSLRFILKNPDITKNELRALFTKTLRGSYLGNADEDDQIALSVVIDYEGKSYILDCVFNIETPNKEIEENRTDLKNHGYPMPYYILNLQEVSYSA